MVICFAFLFALGQLQPQSHASVEGQVVRQGNADPIVRARLVLAKVGGGLGGEYRIFGLPRGFYFVTAIPREGPHIEGDTYVVPAIPSNANGNQSEIRRSGSATLSAGDVDPRAFDDTAYLTAYYPGTTDAAAAFRSEAMISPSPQPQGFVR